MAVVQLVSGASRDTSDVWDAGSSKITNAMERNGNSFLSSSQPDPFDAVFLMVYGACVYRKTKKWLRAQHPMTRKLLSRTETEAGWHEVGL